MGAPLLLLLAAAVTPGGLSGTFALSGWFDGVRQNVAALDRLTSGGPGVSDMLWTSAQIGIGVAVVSTLSAFLAAYAMTHFPGRWMRLVFGLTLLTLFFPVEARLLPTFDVAHQLGLINTLPGLVLPIIPIAVACFYLRQHLLGLPRELAEAAQLDGAGPLRFLLHFVCPLSLAPLGAVFVITFLIGWNQYLWPLMVSVDNAHFPLMRGLNLAGSGSGPGMLIAAASVLPPLVLVLALLRLLRTRW